MPGLRLPKSLRSTQLDERAHLLAACDVYTALREDRPHRPALDDGAAAAVLTDEAERGALNRAAVRHVLDASGLPTRMRTSWPAGLTEREVEVLRLVAQGGTNKDVAQVLSISHRTVQHHVSHIYDKIGVTSRAGAALYAAQHGLTGPGT
jgi:DNA-binding NarL/FixJ family response regulator